MSKFGKRVKTLLKKCGHSLKSSNLQFISANLFVFCLAQEKKIPAIEKLEHSGLQKLLVV